MTNLAIIPDGVYVDGTVGSGGHSLALAEKLGPSGRLVCLDRDPDAIRLSKTRLRLLGDRLLIVRASYGDLEEVLQGGGISGVHGVLLDLGMSTQQLERSGRGFSFSRDEPLDMRMDPDLEVTAGDLVNTLSMAELEGILKKYGEERRARSIARRIVGTRSWAPIRTSLQLAELIKPLFPAHSRAAARHPATRTFQALRIAVNRELEILKIFLERIPQLVLGGGRVVIISYHSLEDRMVKQRMESWERPCTCPPDFPRCVCGKKALFRRIGPRPIRPGRGEIDQNPKARSAVLRAAERVIQ
jgi:16S rRNA (cytosine1402-N4)-methyltransferase